MGDELQTKNLKGHVSYIFFLKTHQYLVLKTKHRLMCFNKLSTYYININIMLADIKLPT